MKSSTYYFYMQTKILAGFHICIRVPLSELTSAFILMQAKRKGRKVLRSQYIV